MEIIGDSINNDRVTCIVAALASSAKICGLTEYVDRLALALSALILIPASHVNKPRLPIGL